jgi:hypothetical protein
VCGICGSSILQEMLEVFELRWWAKWLLPDVFRDDVVAALPFAELTSRWPSVALERATPQP